MDNTVAGAGNQTHAPADSGSQTPLYRIKNLCKEFRGPGEELRILQGLSLDIQGGERVAVVGASGSGKSTLLHILGTLTPPSGGELYFCGRDCNAMDAEQKALLRNREIGFVFQFHHLLPEFTTLENVAMQAVIGGMAREEAEHRAREMLDLVGLGQRADFNVTLLSGGERQRAAIARAVLQKPRVLLADEPTGNLDARNGRNVAELLTRLNAELCMSLIVVTHNPDLARCMGRCFELKSGELYEHTR